MWDIVWVSPQGPRSVSVSRHFLLQAPQCPCSVRKWFSRDHCCRGRSNAWWDWPLTSLTNHHPSVLWRCWLGHLTRKIVSEMTYNVSSGTLNTTILYYYTASTWKLSQKGNYIVLQCCTPPHLTLCFQCHFLPISETWPLSYYITRKQQVLCRVTNLQTMCNSLTVRGIRLQ